MGVLFIVFQKKKSAEPEPEAVDEKAAEENAKTADRRDESENKNNSASVAAEVPEE